MPCFLSEDIIAQLWQREQITHEAFVATVSDDAAFLLPGFHLKSVRFDAMRCIFVGAGEDVLGTALALLVQNAPHVDRKLCKLLLP